MTPFLGTETTSVTRAPRVQVDDVAYLGREEQREQRCRVCGCTNDDACARPATIFDDTREAQMAPDGQLYVGCAWAEPDLCTACIDDAVPGWIHPTREETSP
jgi:hypothetical protein